MPSLGLPIYGQPPAGPRSAEPRALAQPRRARTARADPAAGQLPRRRRAGPRGAFGRRGFLQLLGASAALAGLAGCKPPREKVVGYVRRPAGVTPSLASLLRHGRSPAAATPSAWWSRATRGAPPRSRGTRDHPASLGGSRPPRAGHHPRPLRARPALRRPPPRPAGWPGARSSAELSALAGAHAKPTAAPGCASWRARPARRPGRAAPAAAGPLPQGPLRQLGPGRRRRRPRGGARSPSAGPLEAEPDLASADVILSLDADFLAGEGEHLRHARAFAGRAARRPAMNRLYVAEPGYTVTGGAADHRLRMRGAEVLAFARGGGRGAGAAPRPRRAGAARRAAQRRAGPPREAVAKDLGLGARPRPGGGRPPPAAGAPRAGGAPERGARPDRPHRGLARAGARSIRPPGPPACSGLAAELARRAGRHAGGHRLEPGLHRPGRPRAGGAARPGARAHLPGRPRGRDRRPWPARWWPPPTRWSPGATCAPATALASVVQPLLSPLRESVTELDLTGRLRGAGPPGRLAPRPRRLAGARTGEAGFDRAWEGWLAAGVVPRHRATRAVPAVGRRRRGGRSRWPRCRRRPPGWRRSSRPTRRLLDGRFADNAWLQELPAPDLQADLGQRRRPVAGHRRAARPGRRRRGQARPSAAARSSAPVLVQPGHADDAVTLPLGYGRRVAGAGRAGRRLRRRRAAHRGRPLDRRRPGARQDRRAATPLARTQEHFSMEGRDIALDVRRSTGCREAAHELEELRGDQASILPGGRLRQGGVPLGHVDRPLQVHRLRRLHAGLPGGEQHPGGRQGAGAAAAARCTGCASTATTRGRPRSPRSVSQPLACVHCETAPCEYVCPVNATVHSDEGLNEMVYNRCVGTRYCSNNCPYKVRRFNYLDYHGDRPADPQDAAEPGRHGAGRAASWRSAPTACSASSAPASTRRARRPGDKLGGDAVVSACQQACPAEAIVFGNLNDPASKVARAAPGRAALRPAPRARHPAAHRLPGPAQEPQPGARMSPSPPPPRPSSPIRSSRSRCWSAGPATRRSPSRCWPPVSARRAGLAHAHRRP